MPAYGDAYLLSLVLHDWPDQQAQAILASIAAAGDSGARLLMIEFVVPPGDTLHLSKMSDLSMLAMMGGRERTETEWRELLTAAGFTRIETRQTGTPFSVIQATTALIACHRTDQHILRASAHERRAPLARAERRRCARSHQVVDYGLRPSAGRD